MPAFAIRKRHLTRAGEWVYIVTAGQNGTRGDRMNTYYVMARHSNGGVYRAGAHDANTASEAVEIAKESYRQSRGGRIMKDAGEFRFVVVGEDDYKRNSVYGGCSELER